MSVSGEVGAGIANVVVELWIDWEDDGSFILLGTDTTDANGNYLFTGLPKGTYCVVIDVATLPADLQQTFEKDGSLDGDTQQPLTAGDTVLDATIIPGIPFEDTGTTTGFNDDYDEACPMLLEAFAPLLQSSDQQWMFARVHPDQRLVITLDVLNELARFVPAGVAVAGLRVPLFLAQQIKLLHHVAPRVGIATQLLSQYPSVLQVPHAHVVSRERHPGAVRLGAHAAPVRECQASAWWYLTLPAEAAEA